MKKVTVKLNFPVEIAGEVISEVVLTRPTVKHLMAFDHAEGDMAKMVALIAELGGLVPMEINLIDASDFMRLSEVVENFLDSGEKTGDT